MVQPGAASYQPRAARCSVIRTQVSAPSNVCTTTHVPLESRAAGSLVTSAAPTSTRSPNAAQPTLSRPWSGPQGEAGGGLQHAQRREPNGPLVRRVVRGVDLCDVHRADAWVPAGVVCRLHRLGRGQAAGQARRAGRGDSAVADVEVEV